MIKLTLWILCMVAIYMFSAQTGADSSTSSNTVVLFIYKIIHFIFKSICSYEEFALRYTPLIRKLAHFSEYCLLGIMTYINFKDFFKNKWFLYSTFFCVLYACSDEIHQLFVPNRYCSVIDVGIDTLGSIIGILIIHLLIKRCIKNY